MLSGTIIKLNLISVLFNENLYLLQVCQDKYSVFLVEQSAEAIINNCELKKIQISTKISLAMSLPKNSPYTSMFNYQ